MDGWQDAPSGSGNLLEDVAVHGDQVVADAAMDRSGTGSFPRCTMGGEQGQQVLVAGLAELGQRRFGGTGQQGK
jgi:hypothetical protein